MHAMVVFESMYGNTRDVAAAVAEGLGDQARADLVEVGRAPRELPDDVDLLVVGGPTHALGLSRPGTRQDAAKQADGPLVSAGIGIREWVGQVTAGSRRVDVATFDTKTRKPVLPGSAARAARRGLRRRGFRPLATETFWVTGIKGPLLDGETARARAWAADLAARAAKR